MKERKFTLSDEKTKYIYTEFGEQTRLAAIVGVELSLLSHYLRGRRNIPESVLAKLCVATNKKPSDFLDNPAEKILADGTFLA